MDWEISFCWTASDHSSWLHPLCISFHLSTANLTPSVMSSFLSVLWTSPSMSSIDEIQRMKGMFTVVQCMNTDTFFLQENQSHKNSGSERRHVYHHPICNPWIQPPIWTDAAEELVSFLCEEFTFHPFYLLYAKLGSHSLPVFLQLVIFTGLSIHHTILYLQSQTRFCQLVGSLQVCIHCQS